MPDDQDRVDRLFEKWRRAWSDPKVRERFYGLPQPMQHIAASQIFDRIVAPKLKKGGVPSEQLATARRQFVSSLLGRQGPGPLQAPEAKPDVGVLGALGGGFTAGLAGAALAPERLLGFQGPQALRDIESIYDVAREAHPTAAWLGAATGKLLPSVAAAEATGALGATGALRGALAGAAGAVPYTTDPKSGIETVLAGAFLGAAGPKLGRLIQRVRPRPPAVSTIPEIEELAKQKFGKAFAELTTEQKRLVAREAAEKKAAEQAAARKLQQELRAKRQELAKYFGGEKRIPAVALERLERGEDPASIIKDLPPTGRLPKAQANRLRALRTSLPDAYQRLSAQQMEKHGYISEVKLLQDLEAELKTSVAATPQVENAAKTAKALRDGWLTPERAQKLKSETLQKYLVDPNASETRREIVRKELERRGFKIETTPEGGISIKGGPVEETKAEGARRRAAAQRAKKRAEVEQAVAGAAKAAVSAPGATVDFVAKIQDTVAKSGYPPQVVKAVSEAAERAFKAGKSEEEIAEEAARIISKFGDTEVAMPAPVLNSPDNLTKQFLMFVPDLHERLSPESRAAISLLAKAFNTRVVIASTDLVKTPFAERPLAGIAVFRTLRDGLTTASARESLKLKYLLTLAAEERGTPEYVDAVERLALGDVPTALVGKGATARRGVPGGIKGTIVHEVMHIALGHLDPFLYSDRPELSAASGAFGAKEDIRKALFDSTYNFLRKHGHSRGFSLEVAAHYADYWMRQPSEYVTQSVVMYLLGHPEFAPDTPAGKIVQRYLTEDIGHMLPAVTRHIFRFGGIPAFLLMYAKARGVADGRLFEPSLDELQ